MSSNVDYSLYRKELFRYISSLTIKFHPFAELVENYVANHTSFTIETYHENPYYRNLCGEYSFLDTEMEVWSVEENKMVPFNKDLWITYPGTSALYTYGSEAHLRLCGTYPNQTGLIKSIMYPVSSIDEAYNAPELTLLRHEPSFLRSNEQETIYTAVVEFLKYIKDRWYIYDYGHEDQYYITFMSQLYCNLFSCLIKQRVENQDTHAVHNLHVWERLEANGLSLYRNILNDVQSRWFYRNMRYLKENRGIKSNLIILADNLLENLKVKLVGKKIFQQTADRADECITVPEFLSDDILDYSIKGTTVTDNINQLTRTTPSTFYQNIASTYNTSTSLVDMNTVESMDHILNRIYAEGYYPKYSIDNSADKEYMFGRTLASTVPTRVLEFKKVDAHNPYELPLRLFLFDTLMYQSAYNKLQYQVSFTDTNTGIPVKLSVSDTIILMHYACHKQYGLTPILLPKICTVDTAYKMIPPRMEDLPTHVYINSTSKYSIDQIIKSKELYSDIPWTNGVVFHDVSKFMLMLGDQFEMRVKYVRTSFVEAHINYQRVLWYYHNFFLAKEHLNLRSEDIPYTTWIESDESISDLISAYDDAGDTKIMYSDLANTLLSKVLPIELSEKLTKYAGFIFDDTEYYEKLKQLFVDWTSHDLTYLDTDRAMITWLDMGFISTGTDSEEILSNVDIVLGGMDEVFSYIHEEDVTNLSNIYSAKPTLNELEGTESTSISFNTDVADVTTRLRSTHMEITSDTDVYSTSSIQLTDSTPFTVGATMFSASPINNY